MSDKSDAEADWEGAREILQTREQEVRLGLRDQVFDDDPYYLSEDKESDINAYLEAMNRPSGRHVGRLEAANRFASAGLNGLARLAWVVVTAIWPKQR